MAHRVELGWPRSGRGVWGAAPTKQASSAPAKPPTPRGQKFGLPWPNFWPAELAAVTDPLLDCSGDRRGPRALVEAVARDEAEGEALEAEGHAAREHRSFLRAPD